MTATEILDHCRGLILTLSRRAAARFGEDVDDWRQDLHVELIRHAHTYDPARGAVTTWVTLRWQRLVGLRNNPELRQNRRVPTCSLDADAYGHVDARAPDPADEVIARELASLVGKAMRSLPKRQRVALGARYGVAVNGEQAEEGATNVELARRWGVVQQRVSSIRQQAKRNIRRELEAVGVRG